MVKTLKRWLTNFENVTKTQSLCLGEPDGLVRDRVNARFPIVGGKHLTRSDRSAVSEGSGPTTRFIVGEIEETLRDLLEQTRGRRCLPRSKDK